MGVKKAGVLGATGSVGQRFILLLADHPDFEITALGASSRSAGKRYEDAVVWKQTSILPEKVTDMKVVECTVDEFKGCDIVFSGLEAEQAEPIEREFVDAGINVISNAKSYRRDPEVPLVVPTANPEHLDVFKARKDSSKGRHVCISNCSTAGLVVPLKALQDKLGPLDTVVLTTMQAVSGAGFSPGVPSMDAIDNLVPFISGEEDKLEWEPRKILGTVENGVSFKNIADGDLKVSATCTRVPVTDGHTASVAFKFKQQPPPSLEEVKKALSEYRTECQELNTHSAPKHAIDVLEQPNRPQPRLDRDRGNGYTVSVGRLREDPVFDYKFVCLSHNTVLGAAGSGILIAELLKAKNLI
uniref:Aspartate-semialdehyde dehydrogenase n=1 Tax=Blastobotrys adeninivorans TaxID=409370 RepID=A0A060SY03_BLAAD